MHLSDHSVESTQKLAYEMNYFPSSASHQIELYFYDMAQEKWLRTILDLMHEQNYSIVVNNQANSIDICMTSVS